MERHDDQVRLELQQQYDTLTSHIAALNVDLGRELDAEKRQVLQERRDEASQERRRVVARQTAIEAGIDVEDNRPVANSRRKPERKMQAVDYDELLKLIYEIRSDVAVLKEQMLHLRKGDVAAFPPQYLMLLVIGGVVTLLLLMYVVVQIGVL